MITWGINALSHDASIAVFSDLELVSHRRSEEFSGVIADPNLDPELVNHMLRFGIPDRVYWYEQPWLKKLRQLRAGQFNLALSFRELPRVYLDRWLPKETRIHYTLHHHSHASAGYYTSDFDQAAVVVIDAIGEFDSQSIWLGRGDDLTCVWRRTYPYSLGLFYSAFTELIGFRPVQQEYLLQQLGLQGDPNRYLGLVLRYLDRNLHKGIWDWPHDINESDRKDIAASVQFVFELEVEQVMQRARTLTDSENLVYVGGCAMNTEYNRGLTDTWARLWSHPWPGDASTALGAVLARTQRRIQLKNPHITHLKVHNDHNN